MKKVFLMAAIVSTMFASCVKNEDGIAAVDKAISFEAVQYATSRALSASQSTYPIANSFGTYAWYAQTDFATNGIAVPFMENEKVSYVAPSWTPAQTYYWPKTGTLTFVSYSPYSETSPVSYSVEKGIQFADYTVGTDDLMYSDEAVDQTRNQTTYETTGVPTLFRHALAKLNIACKASATVNPGTTVVITVKKIELLTICNKGSFAAKPATAWAASTVNTIAPAVYNDVTGKAINKDTATSFVADYIVLPQSLTAGAQQIKITYDVATTYGNKSTITESDLTSTADLYATTLDNWGVNKNITYTLTVSAVNEANPITFDPAVENWSDVDSSVNL